jgi:hypothetical protein
MPRYFFNVHDRHNPDPDAEGVELSDAESARKVAIEGARSLICDDIRSGILDLTGSIEVLDGVGQQVCIVWYGDTVERSPS